MYKEIFFEISGRCNALCPWCYTGRKNRNSRNIQGEYISPFDFEKAIKYMLNNDIVNHSSVINLFNWGEPFLNPNFKDIINILNNYELKYGLSTNASKVVNFSEGNALRNLDLITFSMPGFSQYSYDKIHGFNFEKIKSNIQTILNNFRNCGFKGTAQIAYHVYQFNLNEIEEAYLFAGQNNIMLVPQYAYLAGYSMFSQYLKSELSYEEVKKASQELVLYYLNNKIKEKPMNYQCRQFDILTLDERCNVLTCCAVTEEQSDYSIGKLFDLSLKEIKELKLSREICKECDELGLNYIGGNPQLYLSKYQPTYRSLKRVLNSIFDNAEGKNVGVYGTGVHTDRMLTAYNDIFGSFKFNLFFFDSNEEKWGKVYHNSLINNPQDIEKFNLDRVIISSYSFQEQIYRRIKSVEKTGINIVKIYNEGDESLF